MSCFKNIFRFFIVILFVSIAAKANCQSISDAINFNAVENDTLIKKFQVRKIIVTGTKRTKSYIISREMQIRENDSIPLSQLSKKLEEARRFVYNTTLFNEVTIKVDTLQNDQIDITTDVRERWYIYPVPQFQLVDRNLNDWVNNHNSDLSRVNYGLKFVHYNLTGRRDQLKFTALNGYSRSLSFSYTQPYSNKALTEGFFIGSGFTQTRELVYKTLYDNKTNASYNPGGFINKQWQVNLGYIKRQGVKNKYVFGLSYLNTTVPDSILTPEYNPNYFNSSSAQQQIVDLSFSYQYLDVDNVAYPLEGDNYFINISKRGLRLSGGINNLSFETGQNKYLNLNKKWYLSFSSNAKIKLPFKQAYINQRALGYGENYLRGMENYAIDGILYALAKTTLKKKLAAFKIFLPIKSKTFSKIPFTIFAKTYTDIGYAYIQKEHAAQFNNKFLYTGGFGLDVLTLYDASLRFEYSFNQLGQNGLFLRVQTGF